MARNSESGKFEISGAGVLLLAVATLLASAIVFLLGVYVGKGMVESRMSQAARVVRLPVPAGGTPAKNDEVDVTFWDKLAKGEAATPQPAAPSPTTAETPVRVVPEVPTPAPTSRAAAATPAPAPTRAAAPTKAAAPAHPSAPARASAAPSGGYQVQVNAMSDHVRADQLVLDLKNLGYTAYVSPARVSEKTLYRVRVSGLASEAAARQAVSRLREQGYPSAFLVAEGGGR
jgi:cell division septation protein DedD